MLTATRAFLTAVAVTPDLLGEVASSLREYEPGAAVWIAVTCGTAVERGAPAGLAGPAVFDLLRSWLPKFPLVSENADSSSGLTPEQTALLPLFQYLCQATVAHLARLPAQREQMGQDAQLLDRLAGLPSYGAVWVREALLKSSGTILFLHPPGRIGLRLRYTNVSNCLHLFSLLQTAIGTNIPGGRTTDATIARVARGKSTEAVSDEAWWHYGSAISKKADLSTSIWGEGLVREIPLVDGMPVILAWPPLPLSRSWDAGFLGPHLEAMPADVVIESQLTTAETESWLKRCDLVPRKKWWHLSRNLMAVMALCVLAQAVHAEAAPVRVLFVGNSLTYYNSLPALVTAVAAASTPVVHLEAEMLAAGGAFIRQDMENGHLADLLAARHFDVVVFQEFGGFPACPQGNRECGLAPKALEQAVALIKKSGARPFMLGTYQGLAGQAELTAATRETARHLAVAWFDWGAALHRVSAADASLETLIPNNYHPRPAGSWLAAIGLARLITGAESPPHASAKVCAPDWIGAKPSLSNATLASKQKQPAVNCSEIAESTYQILRAASQPTKEDP